MCATKRLQSVTIYLNVRWFSSSSKTLIIRGLQYFMYKCFRASAIPIVFLSMQKNSLMLSPLTSSPLSPHLNFRSRIISLKDYFKKAKNYNFQTVSNFQHYYLQLFPFYISQFSPLSRVSTTSTKTPVKAKTNRNVMRISRTGTPQFKR